MQPLSGLYPQCSPPPRLWVRSRPPHTKRTFSGHLRSRKDVPTQKAIGAECWTQGGDGIAPFTLMSLSILRHLEREREREREREAGREGGREAGREAGSEGGGREERGEKEVRGRLPSHPCGSIRPLGRRRSFRAVGPKPCIVDCVASTPPSSTCSYAK